MTYREGASERSGPTAPLEIDIGVASDSQFYADLSGHIVGVFASTFLVFVNDTPVEVVVSIPNAGSFRAKGVVRFAYGENFLRRTPYAFTPYYF